MDSILTLYFISKCENKCYITISNKLIGFRLILVNLFVYIILKNSIKL